MKKILYIFLLVMGINQLLSAQVNPDTARPATLSDRELGLQYLEKANNQRTVGWILLVAGVAMTVISLPILAHEFESGGSGSAAGTFMLLGTIAAIASIPPFIAGSKNRGRANILLRHENIRVYNNYGSGKERMVSLGLSIPLGGSRK